jgi:hypothetical protein
MKNKITSQSGIASSRFIIALALCSLGASLCWFGVAGTLSSGTVSPANLVVAYDAGPFNMPNQSPLGLGQLDVGPRCDSSTFPCDMFNLTVSVPGGYAAAHPNAGVKVTLSYADAGSHQSEYDLYVYNGVITTLDGSVPSNHASTGANPEVTTINPVIDGNNHYTVIIVPYIPTHETVHVKIELLSGDNNVTQLFGTADPTIPGVPRYRIFQAPRGSTADPTQGEFNIGFNPHSRRIMVMNNGPVWRLTPGEVQAPAKPECCDALWEDRSTNTTNIGLDPILWTDQLTGRTFVSNSTAGANAVFAYSDSDGDPSTTQPTGWTEFGIAAPNGGADHETIGTGPYPATLPWSGLATPQNQGHAVYYCSQDVVGPASCYRSDTLGTNWGPSSLAYSGNGITSCGGLHGHIHVAPDGTVWLPVKQCGGAQGGALSTTAGSTWTEFVIPSTHSQPQGADPSIAIDSDSTVYYAYVNNQPVATSNPPEGHAHVVVGHRNADNSVSWSRDFDIGASHGIRNVVEIEAVGGSSGRAAVGFLGSDVNGDYQSVTYPGKWYAFIATTYDGGQTWKTVNATPNDPVQSFTGVWQQGGNQPDRNLLDFTEITIDDKGRVLYGYSDGCVTPDCIGGGSNDFTATMTVARQSGGKTLLATYDGNTDTTAAKAAKPACLAGTRDPLAAHLSWKAPDNGGANITSYEIWRGTTPGGEQKVFTTNNPKAAFIDSTTTNNTGYNPAAPDYYYFVKAVNSVGVGVQSNEIHLTIIRPPLPESICVAPGLTELTDPAGDPSVTIINLAPTPAPPGSDLLSFRLTQPYQSDGIPRLTFTINTDANPTSTGPAGSAWYVAMKIPGPDPSVAGDTSTVHYRGVHMSFTNPASPVFESYTPGANSGGGVDGRFVNPGSQKPAEAGSNYDGPNGKITIIVKASDLGLKPGDNIAGFVSGVSQSSDPANVGAGLTALYDQMPDSLSFASSYVVNFNTVCGAMSPGVVSRMIHGKAGAFDIAMATSGNNGMIEPRSGGTSNSYTLVYTFNPNLSFPGAAVVTQGTANVASTLIGPNVNQVTVTLTNVVNAQHLVVSLTGAENSSNVTLPTVTAHMDVLVGDVNSSRVVDSGDVFAVRQQTGQPANATNFRTDVNASGLIDSGDVFITRQHTGTGLAAVTTSNPPPTGGQSAKAEPAKSR